MLKMRLQRTGRKNDASFRFIVTDSRRGPKSGNHVDLLGSYNPKRGIIEIDGEKAKAWIAKGVQVSGTVHNILVDKKIIEGKKINVLSRKSPIIDEAKIKAEADAKAAAEAKAVADAEAAAKAAEEAAAAPVAEEAPVEAAPEVVLEEVTPAEAEVTPEAPVAEEEKVA